MAKRVRLTKADRASAAGCELLSLCQRLTEFGQLNEDGIKELICWLRNHKDANLPAIEFLTETIAKIAADRTITRNEHDELYQATEKILPPESRKLVAQRRKQVEAERKRRLRAAKAEQKERERLERARDLAASGIVMVTGKNGHQYPLDSLVGRVEYGEKTIDEIRRDLGDKLAAIVEQKVHARQRRFVGTFVNETDAAWLIRLPQGGDHWLPKRSTTILRSDPVNGQVEIAISPSLGAEIDARLGPRNLLYFTVPQVAERFNVSVETVRKWIRKGMLGADAVGNGSAAFEYQIPESELHRFSKQHWPPR